MGFSINKKVGKAVVRNKIKRRLKALYQEAYPRLTPGYDYVIVVKNNVADLDFKTIKSAFYHLFRVSKFLKGAKSHEDFGLGTDSFLPKSDFSLYTARGTLSFLSDVQPIRLRSFFNIPVL